MRSSVRSILTKNPVLRAIGDVSFPAATAVCLAKTCVLPVPTYIMRCLPMNVTFAGLAAFDARLSATLFDCLVCHNYRIYLFYLKLF